MSIEQIAGFGLREALGQTQTNQKTTGASFAESLEKAIESTNSDMVHGDQMAQAMAAGEPVGLHETMIAVEKADVALRTFVAVKNRAVEAYQSIMRMQI